MSFTVKLQVNNSKNNMLDKSLTDVDELTGQMVNESSVINPVIRVKIDGGTDSDATQSEIFACNYMTISAFHRSYFITDIKAVRNHIIDIYGHVDVLTTYKDEIRACDGIVSRQQNAWNLYLNDGVFKTYSNPHIAVKMFPSGFTDQYYLLAVAGS